MMINKGTKAPALQAIAWINAPQPIALETLRGKVVVLHAFQMLCPACVTHGLPQATAIAELYKNEEVQVIGLHSVFEHHRVMTLDALKAFVHEYRLSFPIAVDTPSTTGVIPVTMQKLNLQGTPSLVLIDKSGHIRVNHFGRLHDMQVGNLIGQLLTESYSQGSETAESDALVKATTKSCDDEGCSV